MYIQRTLTEVIKSVSNVFSVILITGPRQVGKTTLLETCKSDNRGYVTLDDLDQREMAQRDPALFLQMHKPPIIIDEVQYAPQIFNYIKIAVDKEKLPGMFWLTGSQKFHLMQGITETLAGRVAIIDMLGFSQAEIMKRSDKSKPFLPTKEWIENARLYADHSMQLMDVYQHIWRGSFPKLVSDINMPRDIFYNSYIQTYIQRDIRMMMKIGDEMTFQRFLRAIAARTAQLVNYADLARDVDVDQKTIKSWISILEASGLIYLLYPYHSNVTKRLLKTPKIYFLDTGLCAYLTQWSTPETLEAGAMNGAILETYLFTEILKSYWFNGKSENFYFYRDKDKKEIDLLIDQDNMLYPVEFKKTAMPSKMISKNFEVLENLDRKIGDGGVICFKETDMMLSKRVIAIPISYL